VKSDRLIWYWFPVAGYALVIFSFSALPGYAVNPPFPWSDKIYHLLEYLPFGFLVLRALAGQKRMSLVPALLTAFFVVTLYALSDEIHQLFVPGRQFDVMDLTFDALGGFLGFVPYSLLWRT
jgi:VanZ family protein